MDPGTHRHLYQPPATSSPLSLSPSGQASGLESAAVPPMPTQVSEQQQPGPAARPPGGELLKCHHCSLEFESISKRRTHMRTHQKQTTIRLRDAQGGTSVTVLRVSESSPWFCPLYGCFYSTRHTSSLHPHIRVCYSSSPDGRKKQCLSHYKLNTVPERDPQKLVPAMGPTPDPIVNAHGLIPGTQFPAWNEAPPLDPAVAGADPRPAPPLGPPILGLDLGPTALPSAAPRLATPSPARGSPVTLCGQDVGRTSSVPRGSQQPTAPSDDTHPQPDAPITDNGAQPQEVAEAAEATNWSNATQPSHPASAVSEGAQPETTQPTATSTLLGDAGVHPDGLDQLARAASLADALPANVARGEHATISPAQTRSQHYGPADSDDELDGTPPPDNPGSPLTPPPPEPAPALVAGSTTITTRSKSEPRTKRNSASSAPSCTEKHPRVGRVLYPLWPEGQQEVENLARDRDGSIVCPKSNCLYTTQSVTLLKKHAKNCRPTEQRNKHWHGQKRRDRHFCPHHTCNAEFTTKGQLRAHRRLFHQMKIDRLLYPLRTPNEAVVESVERQDDGKFHCPQEACTYKHQSPELLRKHAQTCGRPRASDGTKSRAVYATGTYRAYSCRHRGIPFALTESEQKNPQQELEGYLDAAKERIENPETVTQRRAQSKRMRRDRRSQSKDEGHEGMDFLHDHDADGDLDDGQNPAGSHDPSDPNGPIDPRPRKQPRLSTKGTVDDATLQHTQAPDPPPAAPVPPPELPPTTQEEPVGVAFHTGPEQLAQDPPPPPPPPAPALPPQAASDAVPHQDVLGLLGIHPQVDF